MVYNAATDFIGLWRSGGGNVSKMELPGLDFVISALARAGVITVSVSATAPVANQSITAWFKPAVSSWTAEGAFFLWDKVTTAYLAATPALFEDYLLACAVRSGVDWWTTTGGAPLNTVGHNGDYAIRTDGVGGIYGPKALSAWPANPLPGTTNEISTTALDNTFGTARGALIKRGVAVWEALAIGPVNSFLGSDGNDPLWVTLSALMDSVFGNVQGSILYRDAGAWNDLPPGVANQVLATGGPGANPAWAPRAAEFPSGTRMIFQQTAAPTGWTKDVSLNDYGLRVVSGAVGVTPGSAFSTVFAQSATGGHSLTVAELAPHNHPTDAGKPSGTFSDVTPGAVQGSTAGAVTSNTGSGDAHTHPINLTLAYADVIIASKD